jgi:hypothetical protein
VDRHFGSRFGTALLLGALGATLQLSQPQQSSTFGQAASERQIAAGAVGARLNDLAERTLEERLNRPPTIEIPAGARLQLLLLQDLVFPGPVASVGTVRSRNPPSIPPLRKGGSHDTSSPPPGREGAPLLSQRRGRGWISSAPSLA